MPSQEQYNNLIDSIAAEIGANLTVGSAGSLKAFGDALIDANYNNAFLTVLANKVGMTIVRDKVFSNPLKIFKKGSMPLGYIVEELGANPADINTYSNASTVSMLNQVKPDVKVAYHELNSKKFTKVSVGEDELREAFKDYTAFEQFVNMIINTLYTGAEIYDFEAVKATFAKAVTQADVVTEVLAAPTGTQASADAFILALKNKSSAMKFPSSDYNKCKDLTETATDYITWTPIEDQVLIIRSDILNNLDIYAMAKAFNISYEKLIGNIVEVDYIDAAKNINAILCDKSFLVYLDKLDKTTSFYNGESLVWNYWYHFWKLYDISPMANCVAFIETATSDEP